MARPIVVIAFLTVGFGKFILFVKKSATNPTDSVKATLRIFGIDDIKPAFYSFIKNESVNEGSEAEVSRPL